MNVELVKIFVGSPSDVATEREAIHRVVEELNTSLGTPNDLRIETLMWEKDTYPAVGVDAQDVINSQLGSEFQIFVGIMWKQFGQPTERAGSGTEEEFNRAYECYEKHKRPLIMFYFNSSPIPQNADFTQFEKVKSFKTRISADNGVLYKEYDGIGEFEKIFRTTLTKCISENFVRKQTLVKDQPDTITPSGYPILSEETTKYLNDIGVSFTHPNVDVISLDDIFIAPYLRDIGDAPENYKGQQLEELASAIDAYGIKYLLIGADVSGKTAICKYLFKTYFNQNLCPILLKGDDFNSNIRTDRLLSIITEKLKSQYISGCAVGKTIEDNSHILIIIDDFHRAAKGNERYWKTLIANLESVFLNIVIVGDTTISTNDLSANPPFYNFQKYSIQEFGPILRNNLIKTWCTLGHDTELEDHNELRRKINSFNDNIKTILGKNYIPSYPFYILGMLQAFETGTSGNNDYSIHGFYYELLIRESLDKTLDDKKELGFYYNYMTNLCYQFFTAQKKQISMDEYRRFHSDYCSSHDIIYSIEKAKRVLKDAKFLSFNSLVRIPHKYVYYFFVAKYLANNIANTEIKDVVSKLSIRIFREEYASILMFLTHLSKDNWIIDTLIANATKIFDQYEPSKLEEDVDDINTLINEIPKRVVELVDVGEKRNGDLKLKEEIERKEKEFEEDNINYSDFSLDDDISMIDTLSMFNVALKTVDILGQVTKKHWGELDGSVKYSLTTSTYNLGLRALRFYLTMVVNGRDEIAEYIKNIVIEKHIREEFKEGDATLYKDKIENTTKNVVINFSFMASWGIIKRISNAIGDNRLEKTFERIIATFPFNSYRLIDLSIKLNHKGIPIAEVSNYGEAMKANKMCFVLLQNLIIDHMYMFDVNYKERSQICSKLGITIQQSRMISGSSRVKRE